VVSTYEPGQERGFAVEIYTTVELASPPVVVMQ
jgi:hypothetical protein